MKILSGDYFEVEPGIVALLAAEFPDIEVRSPASLGELLEQSQGDVNLYVLYAGELIAGQTSDGMQAQVDQQWMVVLSVRNTAAQLDASKSRAVAGPIASRLLRCLMGQEPSAFSGPLIRGSGQAAGYSSSFAYFPFMFKTRVVT